MSQTGLTTVGQADQAAVLRSLIQTSIDLSSTRDRGRMLDRILSDARRLSRAEGGSLYVRKSDRLQFAAAQNDAIDMSRLARGYLGKELPVDMHSLAGYVAATGEPVNIPDSHRLSPGAPYRINRDFDAAAGYRTLSILCLPLRCPDGSVVGVLQLINRKDEAGRTVAFHQQHDPAILSFASLAAVSMHNLLLAEQVRQAHLDAIMRLSVAAEFRDKGTAEHLDRISRLTSRLAAEMGLNAERVELIRTASPMHDIGKIAIPDSILLKPGALTEQERRVVQTHCEVGATILANPTNELMAMAREIALYHHERWDGGGYPGGLAGEDIPLTARITGLADVLDALASRRCYKSAFPAEKVVGILRAEAGRHFDPNVVEALWPIMDEVAGWYWPQQQAPSTGHRASGGGK
jgi:GAF domain-containing protein